MAETYTLHVAGLTRELNICPVNEHLDIAGFIMFSDVELTVTTAAELLKRAPEFDLIVTAESKGIPLAYEMARQSGKNYIPARKGVKLYMKDPVEVEVKSITTEKKQMLVLDRQDLDKISGKRVIIVDDVISTGESLHALEELIEVAGGVVAAKMTVLAEGDAANRDDIIFLQELPLFFK